MIVFGIHCNFFIVLSIPLKTCRCDGFFFFTMQNIRPQTIGHVSDVLHTSTCLNGIRQQVVLAWGCILERPAENKFKIKDKHNPKSKHNQLKSKHRQHQLSWGVLECSEPNKLFIHKKLMWLEVYAALKLWVKQVTYESKISWKQKKAKPERKSDRDLKVFWILPEISAEGSRSRREVLLGLHIYENTPEKLPHLPQKGLQLYLVVQGWSILVTLLRLVSRLHAKTSSPDVHGRKRQNWWSH